MSKLEKILGLVESLEVLMVEDAVIRDGDNYSERLGEIKELLFKEIVKQDIK